MGKLLPKLVNETGHLPVQIMTEIDTVPRKSIYSATMRTLINIRKGKPLQEHQRKAQLTDKAIRELGKAIS